MAALILVIIKRFFFIPLKQHFASGQTLFNWFRSFWIIPTAFKRLEILAWLILNELASSCCIWYGFWSSNTSNSSSSNFFVCLDRCLCSTSKSLLLKRANYLWQTLTYEAYSGYYCESKLWASVFLNWTDKVRLSPNDTLSASNSTFSTNIKKTCLFVCILKLKFIVRIWVFGVLWHSISRSSMKFLEFSDMLTSRTSQVFLLLLRSRSKILVHAIRRRSLIFFLLISAALFIEPCLQK